MSTSELACTYAALILHDDGVDITVSIAHDQIQLFSALDLLCWSEYGFKLSGESSSRSSSTTEKSSIYISEVFWAKVAWELVVQGVLEGLMSTRLDILHEIYTSAQWVILLGRFIQSLCVQCLSQWHRYWELLCFSSHGNSACASVLEEIYQCGIHQDLLETCLALYILVCQSLRKRINVSSTMISKRHVDAFTKIILMPTGWQPEDCDWGSWSERGAILARTLCQALWEEVHRRPHHKRRSRSAPILSSDAISFIV